MSDAPPDGIYLSVSAGIHTTCGIRDDGGSIRPIICWGRNEFGEATPPPGSFRSVDIYAGHACGIRFDNVAFCWGSNYYGRLDFPSQPNFDPPRDSGSINFAQISIGSNHSCGVMTSGYLACWGANQFGSGMPPAGTFKSVSAGQYRSCGVRTDDTVVCWGWEVEGAPASQTFRSVDAGRGDTACGVTTGGSLTCWKGGVAFAPPGNFTYKQVSVGYYHICAVLADDSLRCWGDIEYTVLISPPQGSFRSVSAGGGQFSGVGQSCGVRTDGTLACWGEDRDAPFSHSAIWDIPIHSDGVRPLLWFARQRPAHVLGWSQLRRERSTCRQLPGGRCWHSVFLRTENGRHCGLLGLQWERSGRPLRGQYGARGPGWRSGWTAEPAQSRSLTRSRAAAPPPAPSWSWTLTIGSMPMDAASGSSIEVYLEDDFQVPASNRSRRRVFHGHQPNFRQHQQRAPGP